MLLAITFILMATGYRIVGAWNPDLVNFSPLMALAFCGAIYFRNRLMWLVPFVALIASDFYLNRYYAVEFGYGWDVSGFAARTACFAVALGLGALVAQKKTWLNLFSGALGGSVVFYIVTNTVSWFGDAAYAPTLAGWWQSLTIGHPQFMPTIFFFRNTLVSDLLFTGVFVTVMEYAALRAGRPSLLGSREETVAQS